MTDFPGQRLQLSAPRPRLGSRCRCALDRMTAGKTESTFSDWQMDLAEVFMPQVGMVLTYGGIMGYFLGGGADLSSSFVTGEIRRQLPLC